MVHYQLVRTDYDAVAPYYEDLYRDPLSLAENSFVARLVAGALDSVELCRVLDLGCRTGLGASMEDEYATSSGRRCEYVGIDISPRMIEIARSTWSQQAGFHFQETDIADLTGFADGEFNSSLPLRCLLTSNGFSHVRFIGLNTVLELPLVKPLVKNAATSWSMLTFESRLLGAMPDLAHSLITTAQKGVTFPESIDT